MEILGAIILFILFVFIYTIIAEVFVTLFRITGLTEEKARFQVISMLTNSGYTTREAEIVVNSKIRRKLARYVMMFGYAFTVTIVSTVVNIFLQFRNTITWSVIAFIPMIVGIIITTWFVKKSRWLNNLVDKFILKITSKYLYNQYSNPIIIIDDYGDMVMARVILKIMPKELKDIELSKSNIKSEHGLNILLRKTSTGESLPDANTVFNVGDSIVVVGDEKKIREIFNIKE
ncbi:hypothetical protein [Oceanivirga salmonicida]|uniref:hypothetical protein n=1 Tax=Oceanivirga salmonicida TaxID=1769291 RepID=UPI00083380B0|nr:hypothetical protein [Oceanivirga salmonicida]